MELTRLRADHQTRPVVDQPPYFSWVILSDQTNVMQRSYHLRVRCGDETVWDSGMVESGQSTGVCYQGKPLRNFQDYEWTVEVNTSAGERAQASAFFETAFVDSEWDAEWIASPRKMRKVKAAKGRYNPAELFRRAFWVSKEVARARVYATCRGVYKLSMNGQLADDRMLAPEFTVYSKYLCYQTYDVKALLNKGENCIGMLVGDGWYNSVNFHSRARDFKLEHAILFQIRLEYTDGTEEIIRSDGKVRVSQSSIQYSDLFDGEMYDARLSQEGWDRPGFDDSGWTPGIVKGKPTEPLVAQYGEPVRPVMELSARGMHISPKGETILDFGQNMAGVLRINVHLPKGKQLILDHFETLDQYGNYFNNIVAAEKIGRRQRDIFLSDGVPTVYMPHFTYHGFRYVRVTCDEPIRKEDFTAVVLSSDNENLGSFETSHTEINRLYENTRWSQRSNMVSIPTDCPQREKGGWTGDIQIYAKTALLNENVTPFLTRWLQNAACSQQKNGAIPNVVPLTGIYEFLEKVNRIVYRNFSPVGEAGWGDAICIVPWSMYQVTGNLRILTELYDHMKRWCDYIITTAEKHRGKMKLPREIDRYLWNTGHQYGEWLIPSQTVDGSDKSANKKINSSAYCAPIFGWNSCQILADTAALLGHSADATYYAKIADKMKSAIQKGLIDAEGKMPLDFMGAYVLAIAFDLVPEKKKSLVAGHLLRKIEENDNCLDTGFLATPYLLDALCKIGRVDRAYQLLLQTKSPSWLYAVEHGATTIWENYVAYREDGSPIQTSLNHYAFGCVDDWMFRKIAGIDLLSPGFQKFSIAPEVNPVFSFAKRTYMSEYGRIAAEWEVQGDTFHLKTEVPCNTMAEIQLPNGEKYTVGSGKYEYECKV